MQTTSQKTVVHTEQRASNELGDPATMQSQEPAGLFETLKEGVMAGVETVRDGVNYVAERITGNVETGTEATDSSIHTTTLAPGKTQTIEKTTYDANPEVERRTKIVEHQTRYPNQTGYGVNPKFKEDNDSGALADIKSGLKKGVENIKEGAQEFKEDVKQGAHELKNNIKEGWEDVKIEANKMADTPPPRTYADAAHRLENKGDALLEESNKDFNKARKAQAKANEQAAKANIKANEALNKQQRGEAHLAAAGAEMQFAHAEACEPKTKTVTKTKTTYDRHVC